MAGQNENQHPCTGELIQVAAAYFRKETGFNRLFQLFIKKYQSLGRIGGSVRLSKLTDAEKNALAGIMRRDFSSQRSVTVHLEQFNQALADTKFSGVGLKELLDAYAGKNIRSREDQEREYTSKKAAFFEKMRQGLSHPYSQRCLDNIVNKGPFSRGTQLAYDRQPECLKAHLINVLCALENLPGAGGAANYQRLPVFASDITGDPHGLDADTEQGKLFVAALKYLRSMEGDNFSYESAALSAEQLNELLEFYGLVRDDILNFVTIIGLKGFLKDGKQVLESPHEQGMVMNIPLKELTRLSKVTPAFLSDDNQAVYVVENSGVFSELVDRLKNTADLGSWPYPPLICTHGQFKLATLVLLNLLVQQDIVIYYSGDFDPEGLLMAQRLKQRYPDNVTLWHYDENAYIKSLSRISLPEHRLKKLRSVVLPEMQVVKNLMLDKRAAGYQETLIGDAFLSIVMRSGS